MLLSKFDRENIMVYKGKLDYSVNMKMLGKILTISNSEENSEIFGKFGGDVTSCPFCDAKGLYIHTTGNTKSFDYNSATLRFAPSNGKLVIHLPYDITGGSVPGVKNATSIHNQIQGVSSSLNSVLNIIKSQINNSLDKQIMNHHHNVLQVNIKSISKLLETGKIYYKAVFDMYEKVKINALDLGAVLSSLQKKLTSASPIKSSLRVAKIWLRKINTINIETNTSKINVVDQGMVVSYLGEVCLQNLCLRDMDVVIRDLKSSNRCSRCKQSVSREVITIQASPRFSLLLSRRITIKPRHKLYLQLSRDTNNISGSIEASIMMFSETYDVKFEIKNSNIFYNIGNIKLGSSLFFNISGGSLLDLAMWKSVVYNVKGESFNTTSFYEKAQTFYADTALTTNRRISKLKLQESTSTKKYLEDKNKTLSATKQFNNAKLKYQTVSSKYNKTLVDLSQAETRMKSYLENDPTIKQLIERNLTKVCLLMSCKEVCISMPVYKICQDDVYKEVDTLKCKQHYKKIKTSRLVTYSTQCDVTKHIVTHVYTGTCSPNPSPIVSFFFGFFFWPIFGFFGGIFSSCDRSYEVHTRTVVVQEPCTLTKMETRSTLVQVSTCKYVKIKVFTGYSAPKKCNVEINPCVSKVMEPRCILDNDNCKKKHSQFLASISNIPKLFTDLQSLIETLQTNAQLEFLALGREEINRNFYQIEKNRRLHFARNSRQISIFSNKTKENINKLLKTEICLSQTYRNNTNLSSLIGIRKKKFNVNLPIIKNIEVSLDVFQKLNGKTVQVSFVYDMLDGLFSINTGVKKVITNLLCGTLSHRRKRRALTDTEHTLSPFDGMVISTSVQQACVTLTMITSFFRYTTETLKNITNQAINLKEKVASSQISKSLTVPVNESNAVINAQRALVGVFESHITDIKRQYSIKSILTQAKENIEVFIAMNNYGACFSFEDCVNVAFECLTHLPTVMTVSRNTYNVLVNDSESVFRNIWSSQSENLTLLLEKIGPFTGNLQQINSVALHCSDKPQLQATLPSTVEVMSGNSLTLQCTVTSSLPVTFNWMHHDQFIDGENNGNLTFIATNIHAGVYKCHATSLTGNTTSAGTLVRVFVRPRFIEEPKNIQYLLPVQGPIKPTFICNVTAFPKASIRWYYQSFSKASSNLIREENKTILVIQKMDVTKAGLYFCRANNQYGSIQSKFARLDVLNTVLVSQSLTISVEGIKNPNASIPSFSKFLKTLRFSTRQTITLKYSGKFELKVITVPSQIQNSNYSSMFTESAKLRQDLANSGKLFALQALKNEIPADDGRLVTVDNNSLAYDYKLNICKAGYRPHKNGFLCGKNIVNCFIVIPTAFKCCM